MMRNYGNYNGRYDYEARGRDNYGARRSRDSRGRYNARGNYRGDDSMEEMYNRYQEYSEGREEYNRGNYGAKQNTIESLECMMEAVVDFVEALKQEASGEEEMQIIRKYTRQISEM